MLAVVVIAQFMVILDATIVNVALPTIKVDVGFSEQSLSWVLNAYTLIFGGFLLLGGRAADRLGRRRVLMAGIALFSGASLLCGLSQSEGTLLVARGLQGLGGAMVSPAALSIILTTFAEGPSRNRALAVWGAVAGAGGAIGLLLGGVIVQLLSWRWIFFVNVPIGAVVLALAPRFVPESRSEAFSKGGYDLEGALAATLGTITLVFTLIKANSWGWTAGRTLGGLAIAAALLVGFVFIERRHRDPLVPLRIFSNPQSRRLRWDVSPGSGSPVRDVLLLHALPAAGPRLQRAQDRRRLAAPQPDPHRRLGAGIPPRRPFHSKAGARHGTARDDGRLRAPHPSDRAQRLCEPRSTRDVVLGPGLGLSFVPVTIAATNGVESRDSGLASGLLNTTQKSAARWAWRSSPRFDQARDECAARWLGIPVALTHGFKGAFIVAGVLCAIGAVLASVLIPGRRREAADGRVEVMALSFIRCPSAPYCGHLARVAAFGRRVRGAFAR